MPSAGVATPSHSAPATLASQRLQNPVPIAIGLHHHHRRHAGVRLKRGNIGTERGQSIAHAVAGRCQRPRRLAAVGWSSMPRTLLEASNVWPMARANSCGQHARMGGSRDRLNGSPELTGSLCIQTSRQQRRANTAENIARTRLLSRPVQARDQHGLPWAPQPVGCTFQQHCGASLLGAGRDCSHRILLDPAALPMEQAGQLARMWSQQPARRSRPGR